jgi:hypothetical protein
MTFWLGFLCGIGFDVVLSVVVLALLTREPKPRVPESRAWREAREAAGRNG